MNRMISIRDFHSVKDVVDREFHDFLVLHIHRLMLINDHIDHNENNPNEIVDKNVFEEKIHSEQMIDDIWHIERQII